MTEASKVFISHASADQSVAELLRETLVLGGIPHGHIFYSSSRATGIPTGVDFRERLRTELQQAGLVLELVSKVFLTRPMCLLELGGAWALNKSTYPIVIPPLTRNEAAQEIGSLHMGLLDKEADIDEVFDELRDRLAADIGVETPTTAWNNSIRRFKAAIGSTLLASSTAPRSASPGGPVGHPRPKLEILDYNFVNSRFGGEVHGEVANNDSVEHSATIKATFYDASGKIVGTADGIASQVAPGETKTFSLSSVGDIPAHDRFKVQVDAVF